jgi:hypothetical protein
MPIAIVLVLIGIITLAVGVFSATVGWVYVSIASTAAAGVVLFVVHQSGRRRPSAGPAGDPAGDTAARPGAGPADDTAGGVPRVFGAQELADAGAAPAAGSFDAPSGAPAGQTLGVPAEPLAPAGAAPPAAPHAPAAHPPAEPTEPAAPAVPAGDAEVGGAPGDGAFPIATYDELRVTEVLPLLASLDAAALAEVRDRETQGKHRATVLARIDELLGPTAPVADTDGLRPTPDAAEQGRG